MKLKIVSVCINEKIEDDDFFNSATWASVGKTTNLSGSTNPVNNQEILLPRPRNFSRITLSQDNDSKKDDNYNKPVEYHSAISPLPQRTQQKLDIEKKYRDMYKLMDKTLKKQITQFLTKYPIKYAAKQKAFIIVSMQQIIEKANLNTQENNKFDITKELHLNPKSSLIKILCSLLSFQEKFASFCLKDLCLHLGRKISLYLVAPKNYRPKSKFKKYTYTIFLNSRLMKQTFKNYGLNSFYTEHLTSLKKIYPKLYNNFFGEQEPDSNFYDGHIQNLKIKDLRYLELENVTVKNVIFENCNFEKFILKNLKLINVSFIGCSFWKANISCQTFNALQNCVFKKCKIHDSSFQINSTNTKFMHSTIQGLEILNSPMKKTVIDTCQTPVISFIDSTLVNFTYLQSNGSNTLLKNCNLSSVDIPKIKNVNLINPTLINTAKDESEQDFVRLFSTQYL
ncbi:pentapeptide repeat-containing protein [Candidatus Margulisiibacteriota bacterium]